MPVNHNLFLVLCRLGNSNFVNHCMSYIQPKIMVYDCVEVCYLLKWHEHI
jgi:hypothetical protein